MKDPPSAFIPNFGLVFTIPLCYTVGYREFETFLT